MKKRAAPDEAKVDLGERTDKVPTVEGEDGEEDLSSEEERAIEERLRYLGYID